MTWQLRHGAMTDLFRGVRTPSTLGCFRARSPGATCASWTPWPASRWRAAAPAPQLPGADALAFIDMDSMQKRVYGHAKQGAGFGHTKIQGKSLMVRA